MILYKGSPLVKGKHFIYENNVIEYKGKVYGESHLFETKDKMELVLSESEALTLMPLLEHSLLAEQDNSDDLYQLITSYTDRQLDIAKNSPSNKLWTELKDSFQEEINKLSELGLAYKVTYNKISNINEGYLLEMIIDFLEATQRNISETSLPNIYAQLNDFIYNIDQLKGGNK